MKKLVLTTLVYSILTMILGVVWHFGLFKEVYDSLGIYNRAEPIIPLGFASMIIQGAIMAYLYPFFYRGGNPVVQGIKFGLTMGLFMFSVSTLANAAKIEVTSMSTWLMLQVSFHALQFTIVGGAIGWISRKN